MNRPIEKQFSVSFSLVFQFLPEHESCQSEINDALVYIDVMYLTQIYNAQFMGERD